MGWLQRTKHHLIGATLLIAGTSIGVGMLALPVVTAEGGFVPSFVLYIICWLFMIGFARLILETCTWVPKGANLITITKTLLGKKGAAACWILYLFLFYCLLTAHSAAGGEAIFQLTNQRMPYFLSVFIYVAFFAPVVYFGTLAVDRLNIGLMLGVLITYTLFAMTTLPYLDASLLKRISWTDIWPALPIILTAFGFQNLIPTLYNYMEGDHRTLRKAIWIGSSIPLSLYVIWELLVLGVAPLPHLQAALTAGESAISALQTALQSPVAKISQGFAFFAMTTSFIGIAISFFDFWADGLKWKKTGIEHLFLICLVFLIPMILVFFNKSIFIAALNLGGGVGMILLFGILPVLCVWSGRYYQGRSLTHQFMPGGKFMLSSLLLFCLLILAQQFFQR